MDCEQVLIELPSLLRGELGPELESEVQRHLAGCDRCRTELVELESTLTLVSAAGVSSGSPELRASVLGAAEAASLSSLLSFAVPPPPARIKEELMAAAEATLPAASGTVVPLVRSRRTTVARVLASAAILVAGIVLGSTVFGNDRADRTDLAGEIPEGHETQILALVGMGPPEAMVRHYRHDNFRVTLSVEGFEATPAGSHYAVWVRGDDGDVAVGTFRLKRDDDFKIPFAVGVNPSEYPAFVVTLEPNDGNPLLTGDVVTEGSFDPSQVHHGRYDE